MSAISQKLRAGENGSMSFHCPGCKETHTIYVGDGAGPRWTWNGSIEQPSFQPSVLVRSGHYVPGHPPGECWCSYNAKHPEELDPFTCSTCHSFVTDGKIHFLADCSHALAGTSVDLPDWPQERP